MVSTVRYDVDEANEATAGVAGCDPAQTMWADSIPPADLGVSAMGIDEVNHLRIGQRTAPAVRDAVRDELWSNSGRSQEPIRLSSSVSVPQVTFANAGTSNRLACEQWNSTPPPFPSTASSGRCPV